MLKSIRNKSLSVLVSFITIFIIIWSGSYISKVIDSKNYFFMEYVKSIKSEGSLIDKIILVKDKNSFPMIKKYLEATADAMIEFDDIPSMNDIIYFFEIIVLALDNDIYIENIELRKNKIQIYIQKSEMEQLKVFLSQIEKIKYVNNVKYQKSLNYNYKNGINIFCIHNDV